MNDREHLMVVCKGNTDAVDFLMTVYHAVSIWDDLIDKDKPVDDSAINSAFIALLVDMNRNPFFRQYVDHLLPVIELCVMNWMASNNMAKHQKTAVMSFCCRQVAAQLIVYTARIIGGPQWAEQHIAGIMLRAEPEEISDYLKEHGHGMVLSPQA